MQRKKVGVILMNLGGPRSLAGVRDFLYNLFSDPFIIGLPNPLRYLLAQFISWRRTDEASEIYEKIGGCSPIYANTLMQVEALQAWLDHHSKDTTFKVVMAMRYAPPRADEAVKELESFQPDAMVVVPLYPQYSTTTTASSFLEFDQLVQASPLISGIPCQKICCYPTDPGFIQAQADLIIKELQQLPPTTPQPIRLLFSAHGLPQHIVNKGDPYPDHVTLTLNKLVDTIAQKGYIIEAVQCYQSKVGPIPWLKPSIDEALQEAANDGVGVVVVPLSFVSEHSETLVELDMQYRDRAQELALPFYLRAGTVMHHADFIASLGTMVQQMLTRSCTISSNENKSLCPKRSLGLCPCANVQSVV